MATVIRLRRGNQADWENVNPVLAAGEPAYVYETKQLKIGDGVTAWNDLQYASLNDASGTLIVLNPLDPDPDPDTLPDGALVIRLKAAL